MRVLLAANLDSANPFGQFTRPFGMARELAARGVEVGVVGIDCSAVTFGPTWSTGSQSARRTAGALRQAIRTFRPDVIDAHQNMPGAVATLVSGDIPVAADFHAVASADWQVFGALADTPLEKAACRLREARAAALERLILRRADLVIAASEGTAEHLQRRYRPATRPTVVVNGIATPILDAPDPPCPAALAAPGPHAVTSLPVKSSPTNEQALRLLLQAAQPLARAVPGAQIHVLGTEDGPPADGVHYHGTVPELLPYLHHADACLLPLPPMQGEFGGARTKLLDALGRGRTVVTTQEGLAGLEEAASWPGVVVAPDDPDGFAAAMARAFADGAGGFRAREAQTRQLRWDVLAGDLEAILAGLVERRR